MLRFSLCFSSASFPLVTAATLRFAPLQILKVAGFDKPQRTRVLEREVQKGTHEKVQGGYGKYQGKSDLCLRRRVSRSEII